MAEVQASPSLLDLKSYTVSVTRKLGNELGNAIEIVYQLYIFWTLLLANLDISCLLLQIIHVYLTCNELR